MAATNNNNKNKILRNAHHIHKNDLKILWLRKHYYVRDVSKGNIKHVMIYVRTYFDFNVYSY